MFTSDEMYSQKNLPQVPKHELFFFDGMNLFNVEMFLNSPIRAQEENFQSNEINSVYPGKLDQKGQK